ncbi:MAG: RNA polymerase sporulation sigma factor SigK [Clostridia bacterium]|nr:RNA polymerase sporulation sigma factor SigK [Clostridia bacterium]MBR4443843.1 RNA polymerase sporulation sigma factor SigK [Clostridia bacterium]
MFFQTLGWLARLFDEAWLVFCHVANRSSFPRALTPEEERETVRRMQAGDGEARGELIEHNLRLVAHIARKYAGSGIDQDDLVSIGSIGLIKAVKSFRPESGRLASYAARCIENEILMALRSNRKTKGDVSLNAPVGSDKEGNEIMLSDILGTDENAVPDAVALRIESSRAIRALRETLDARERAVVLMRYGLSDGRPRSQHEIASMLGISRSYVSRIEKKALQKIKSKLNGEKI